MYTPTYTAERRLEKLHSLIEEFSFGTLICPADDGTLDIAHLPFILEKQDGPNGTLLAHVARANPIWQSLNGKREVVVIFQGPHGYISPTFYSSRAEVPTWNYAVVHAYGIPNLLSENSLTDLLNRMTEKYERGNPDPWKLEDLPTNSFSELKAEIVGLTIHIARLEGKFKLSQNRSEKDRIGAIDGVLRRGNPLDLELARLMKEISEVEKSR